MHVLAASSLRRTSRSRSLPAWLVGLLCISAASIASYAEAHSGRPAGVASPSAMHGFVLAQATTDIPVRLAQTTGSPRYRVATAPTATTIEQRPSDALVEEAFRWAARHGIALELRELEPTLFVDASDGQLDDFSLLEAALIASGVHYPAELARYRNTYESHLSQLRQRVPAMASDRQRARIVFEYMHTQMLRTYGLTASELTGVLDRGLFNCVSSAVLFSSLASEFELQTGGVEIPGHAFSYLVLPDGQIDIETTCPDWFSVLEDPQRQAELLRRSLGVNYDPSRRNIARREVPTLGLIAVIYYNRGVDRLEQRKFSESVADNLKALRIDADSAPAWGNFLASINNWALALAEQGAFPQALDMLADGRRFAPGHGIFRTNTVAVYQQWVDRLLQADQPQEALARIHEAQTRFPEEPHFARLAMDLTRRTAWQLVLQGNTTDAMRMVSSEPHSAEQSARSMQGLLELAAVEQNHGAASALLGEAQRLNISQTDYDRLRDVCFDAYRQCALRSMESRPGKCAEAVRGVVAALDADRALAADAAMQATARGWLVEAWRNESEAHRQRSDWKQAAVVWDHALTDPLLAGHRHWQAETQRWAERHYAAWTQMLMDRHDIVQATEVCQRGLNSYPGSGQLQRLHQMTAGQLAAQQAAPIDQPAGEPVSRGWRGSRVPAF